METKNTLLARAQFGKPSVLKTLSLLFGTAFPGFPPSAKRQNSRGLGGAVLDKKAKPFYFLDVTMLDWLFAVNMASHRESLRLTSPMVNITVAQQDLNQPRQWLTSFCISFRKNSSKGILSSGGSQKAMTGSQKPFLGNQEVEVESG